MSTTPESLMTEFSISLSNQNTLLMSIMNIQENVLELTKGGKEKTRHPLFVEMIDKQLKVLEDEMDNIYRIYDLYFASRREIWYSRDISRKMTRSISQLEKMDDTLFYLRKLCIRES